MDSPGYRAPANGSVDPTAVCHPRRRRTTDAESEDPTPGSAGLRRTRCSLVRTVRRPFERRLALPGQDRAQSCRRQKPDQPAAGRQFTLVRLVELTAVEARADDVKLCLGERALHAEHKAVVELGRVVTAVLVDYQ